ncbi:MAG: YheT family hydrolase [Bacteroidota bacterium]
MTDYRPPRILFNRHLETIYPSLVRKVELQPFVRERIPTHDDDFLDLDWITQDSKNLVIISHGLEGNSGRPYVKGMARIFAQNKFDVLAWNYRGCSEEMNRQLRFYHSGATDDLSTVVDYAATKGYDSIYLIGFSLGGNLTLKFLGERGSNVPTPVKGAAAFSVPIDLHGSCLEISKPGNWIYAQRFLRSLKKKVVDKARVNNQLDVTDVDKIETLIDFDNRYTSVLHGYKDAVDYYTQCSAIHYLDGIDRPTLLVNAKNDPFLSDRCYPQLASSSRLTCHYPNHGGHVGFTLFNQNGLYWSELRALDFIQSI